MKNKAYYQDWVYLAFRELAISQFLSESWEEIDPFLSHQAFCCFQSIEKIFKALLIKKNKILDNKNVKSYSHKLSKIIRDIKLSKNQRNYLFNEFCIIGKEFHDGFGLFAREIDFMKSHNFSEDDYRMYGISLRYFSVFLDLLEAAYFETRYPYHHKLTKLYKILKRKRQRTFPLVYEDISIFIATIRTFKVIIKLLGKNAESPLDFYTWRYQKNGYEQPTDGVIYRYKKMERLVNFILGKRKTLFLDRQKIHSKIQLD